MRVWERIRNNWGLVTKRGTLQQVSPLDTHRWICNICGFHDRPTEFRIELVNGQLKSVTCPSCHNIER